LLVQGERKGEKGGGHSRRIKLKQRRNVDDPKACEVKGNPRHSEKA